MSAALFLAVVAGGSSVAPAVEDENSSPSRPVSEGAVSAITLEEAVRLALSGNPVLRQAGGRVVAAEGQAAQARVWPNPELELSAEEWPVSGGSRFSDAKQTIGVTQTLPFPGKKALDRRIGRTGVKLSKAALDLRRTELVRDVTAAFYRVLAAEKSAEVARELARVAESSAETARKRVEAGAIAYQEQLRAEIQLEQARTDLTNYQRDLAATRETLATLLGRPDLAGSRLAGSLAESSQSEWLNAPPREWISAHPSVAAALAEVERAELELRRARLEPYPDVKAGVAGGRLGDTDESIVEVRLAIPLPLFDRSKGRKFEAQANVAIAQAELDSVTQQLQAEWRKAVARHRAAADQVAKYRDRILPKATEALRLVQAGFDEGKFAFMDLLDTQRTTAEARLAYQMKLLELSVAQAELAALLRPETNFNSTTK